LSGVGSTLYFLPHMICWIMSVDIVECFCLCLCLCMRFIQGSACSGASCC
jgi:hypothetical protein